MKLALLAAFVVGCNAPAFDPPSLVESVRILATSADKPYAAPGDSVTMSVLAFDGRPFKAAPMNVYWLPTPCFDPPGDAPSACYPFFARTFRPGTDIGPLLTAATTFAFQMPKDVIAAHHAVGGASSYGVAVVFTVACAGHVEYVPSAGTGGPDAVPLGCFDAIGTRLSADDFVFAYSLIYSFADRTNANPVLQRLTFGGVPVDPTAGITVNHCTVSNVNACPKKPIDAVLPPSSQELDPSNLDASGNILREEIYVDYYLTAGRVANDVVVLFDPREGRLSGTGDDFYVRTSGDYRLWAVVHDNRGGVSWQDFALHVR